MQSTSTGRIFGVDEAGRGAMAGPLAVAAVEAPFSKAALNALLDLDKPIRDSKSLSARSREIICHVITEHCRYACVMIGPEWIDEHGIQEAETSGLIQATNQLAGWGKSPGDYADWPDKIICDGTRDSWGLTRATLGKRMEERMEFVVQGDKHVYAISAASIVAKVMRDEYMKTTLHEQHPQFRFDLHVGYVTPLHLAKLQEFGSIPEHRHTFRPVRERDARG